MQTDVFNEIFNGKTNKIFLDCWIFSTRDQYICLYLNLDLDEAMGRAYTENISIPFGVGICGSVAETKETIYIRDAYNDTRFNREVDAQTGYTTHSLVSMPVCNADGEVIGVAQIMNKTGNGSDKSQHEFSDTDLKVFRRYLTFCGIGLQNAQLFEVSILEYKKNKVRTYVQ